MSSLYIHIPFCKTRCGYCDFHSSTCTDQQQPYIEALGKEIAARKDYLPNTTLSTIYMGGGTPSLLTPTQLNTIFDIIKKNFTLKPNCEISLECNPDDINTEYLRALKNLGINRLSIGIQSFNEDDLRTIGRRHTGEAAINAIKLAQEIGFNNINIDLIFGLPFQDLEKWTTNLDIAFSLNIQHISSYALIYEKGTAFYQKLQKGIYQEVDEDTSLAMYTRLIEKSESKGFQHYETSNFSLPNFHSRHNSNYWSGHPYLGIGAGAHSFDGTSRQWNIADNNLYINGITNQKPAFEIETIDPQTAYNEYIMTGLRTMWGCKLTELQQRFGKKTLDYCLSQANPYINSKKIIIENDVMKIAKNAIFISDQIMSDLMQVD